MNAMLRVSRDLSIDERHRDRLCPRLRSGQAECQQALDRRAIAFRHARITLPEDATLRLNRLAGQRMTSEGVIVIHAQRFRTQERNRADASTGCSNCSRGDGEAGAAAHHQADFRIQARGWKARRAAATSSPTRRGALRRLTGLLFDAFYSREPVSTSLENAVKKTPADGRPEFPSCPWNLLKHCGARSACRRLRYRLLHRQCPPDRAATGADRALRTGLRGLLCPAAPGCELSSSSSKVALPPCVWLLPCTPPRILLSDEAPCTITGPATMAETASAIAEVFTNFIQFSLSLNSR